MLGSGTNFYLVERFSEPAHSLLLLPRQFYGVPLSGAGVYFLEKTCLAKIMPNIL